MGVSPAPVVAQHRLDAPWSLTRTTARPWSGRRRAGGWPRSGPRPTPSTWAAWRFTRPWCRGESSCLAPRRRRRPTTGGPSRGRPEDGPLETRTPGGWRAVASSPHGTLQDAKGVLHIPPPEVKEQLHHIPPGYTAKAGADAKTRHRMVGNGWHWGVASRLLGLLIMTTWAKPVGAGTAPAPTPRRGTIPWLSQLWTRRGWDFAPPQAESSGVGRGPRRGQPLGGRGSHGALPGRLAVPGAGARSRPRVSPGVAPRSRSHPPGRPRRAPGAGRHVGVGPPRARVAAPLRRALRPP